MELASGYSDGFNYGNGYTPLATGAINNNNANYAANQEYARLMGQYNPFAQSGGFGAMTDYYSNAGAAYGRATGGFGGYGAANADPFTPVQPQQPYSGGGIGSDAARAPNQPQPQQSQQDLTARYWELMAPNRPNSQALLGYDPNNPFVGMSGTGGGIGSDAARTPNQPDPYQQWLQSNAPAAGGYSGGGIGSDTSRDALAWTLAQSSPFAGPGTPSNGPYPNLGYNPGMANAFANPTMQQYDWTKNNDQLQQQMQDALKTIDGATGQKAAEPYGGKLPDFWQGVRDWTGMGAPQPIWQPSS